MSFNLRGSHILGAFKNTRAAYQQQNAKSRNQALQYILNLETPLSTSSHTTIFSGFLKVRSDYDLAGEESVASEKQTNQLNHQGFRPWACQWSVPCKSFSLFLPPHLLKVPTSTNGIIIATVLLNYRKPNTLKKSEKSDSTASV